MIHAHPFPAHLPFWPALVVLLPMLGLGACGGGDDAPERDRAADSVALGAVPSAEVATNPVAAPTPAASPSAASSPVPAPAPAPAPLPSDGFCGLAGFQVDLLQRINAARSSARNCGGTGYPAAAPLNWSGPLFAAAEAHARDMAVNDYFSHTGLDGRSVSQRVSSAGYSWQAVGENIAAGQSDANAVMSGWLASPGHCSNIMSAQYQDVAVACAQRTGSAYGRYWTMVLARPS